MSSTRVETVVPAVYEYGVYGIDITLYDVVLCNTSAVALSVTDGTVQVTVPVVVVNCGQVCEYIDIENINVVNKSTNLFIKSFI